MDEPVTNILIDKVVLVLKDLDCLIRPLITAYQETQKAKSIY